MKSLRFLCSFSVFVFAALMIVLSAAQSNPEARANQPKALPDSQQPPARAHAQLAPFALPAQTTAGAQLSKQRSASAPARFAAGLLPGNGFAPAQAYSGPLTFLPGVGYASGGYYADSVVVADVNGDGKPDLVVANYCASDYCTTTGSVSVLLGNGDGTFQPAVSYSTGGVNTDALAVSDLNGDGKLDIVVVNCGPPSEYCEEVDGVVGVLLGNGDGTFQPVVTFDSGGMYPQSLAVGDLNGDGHPDLVVIQYLDLQALVTVFVGKGDGAFQPPVSYSLSPIGVLTVVIADVNGDGKPDLVMAAPCVGTRCAEGEGAAAVMLGNGDGTFQPAVAYSSGAYDSLSLAVGDFNGDGRPDIAVISQSVTEENCPCGVVSILLGNGDGTFQPPVLYYAGGVVPGVSIAAADVNGDGHLDLVVADQYISYYYFDYAQVSVLMGYGDGTFQTPIDYPSPDSLFATSVAVADVNGDGKPDVLLGIGYVNPETRAGEVDVLLNNYGAPPTTISLVPSKDPIILGKVVTYTAAVAGQSGGTLGGNVAFADGPFYLATVPLSNNQATLSTKYKKISTHPITAAYSGVFQQAEGSMSTTVTEYACGGSNTKVATSGSPSQLGQPVTFTATVKSYYGQIPNGEQVTFLDEPKNVLGSVPLAGGQASLTTSSLSAKKHVIKAIYPTDDYFCRSSGQVVQVVEK